MDILNAGRILYSVAKPTIGRCGVACLSESVVPI